MRYQEVSAGVFLDRPNRFIARCRIDGLTQVCHVKNTGRCRELLVPGCTVYLHRSHNPARKTAWDLIAVEKGAHLINMDSAAPNRVVAEWLPAHWPDALAIHPEYPYGQSRMDFYIQRPAQTVLLEVKGVTLEEQGVALFPDAPTLRGVKHLRELTAAARAGYEAVMLFVIQMDYARMFSPNEATHPQFAQALRQAQAAGVKIQAYDCAVTPDSLVLRDPVPIKL